MVPISKWKEPVELIQVRKKVEKTGRIPVYEDLQNPEKNKVLEKLIMEQGGLCAYCMCRIPENKQKQAFIEHIVPRSKKPELGLSYKNMIAVCSGNRASNNEESKSCDASRGNKDMVLNPCKRDTLVRIYYTNSGQIHSTDEAEEQNINDVLHLNSARDLVRLRKAALNGMQMDIDKKNKKGKLFYTQMLDSFQSEGKDKPPYVGILIWWLRKQLDKY